MFKKSKELVVEQREGGTEEDKVKKLRSWRRKSLMALNVLKDFGFSLGKSRRHWQSDAV